MLCQFQALLSLTEFIPKLPLCISSSSVCCCGQAGTATEQGSQNQTHQIANEIEEINGQHPLANGKSIYCIGQALLLYQRWKITKYF